MVSKSPVFAFSILILCTTATFGFFLVSYASNINATITTGLFTPLSPLNLAVSISDRSVALSWSPPSSNGGSALSDYVIEYKLTTGGVWAVFPDSVSASTSMIITGLTNDTSYDFRVSGVNAIGQGPASTPVSATPGAPAQVLVTGMSDVTIPTISTSVRITNEGAVAYEYQYTWCVTSSDVNLCGGGDDIFNSTAAKLILPGESWDTSLSSTVPTIGNYWFHVQVLFGSDSSYASQSFTALRESRSGSGGGGSSGSGSKSRSCSGGDFNRDNIVSLVDFSIFLMSYNKPAPFPNPCVDINSDTKVNVVDFSILLTQWGKKPILYK